MFINFRLTGLLGITVLYGAAAYGNSKTPGPLTLEWVIEQAKAQSPKIAVSRAKWEASIEEIPQVSSLGDPSLYTMFHAVPHNTTNPFSAREIWLGIKQRFPYPGKLSLKGEIASKTADVAYEGLQVAEEEVVYQAKKAYFDLYLIHKELEITAGHVELAREFSQIAESKYVSGKGTQISVLKALIEVSHLSNQLLVLGQRRQRIGAQLNTLLNRSTRAPLSEPAELPLTPLTHTLDQLQQGALQYRPELRSSRVEVLRSDAAIRLAKKEYYPDLAADLSYWTVRNHQNQWQLMVEASFPIAFWSRDRLDARERQAKIQRKESEAALEDLERKISFEVEAAFVAVQEASITADHYRRVMIPQARQAVETIRAAYRTDRDNFLNLLDSERNLLQYELDFHRVRVTYEKTIAGLERASGIALRPTKEMIYERR